MSFLITQLWEEGKVDLDKPPTDYLPFLKGTAWDNVTVEVRKVTLALGIGAMFSYPLIMDTIFCITIFVECYEYEYGIGH